MSWTDERIDQLKQLWEKGLTASQIAEKLAGGISRNAVIGKAHRLGLKARPSPVKSGEGVPAAEAPVAAAEARPVPVAAAAAAPVAEAPRPKPAAPRAVSVPTTGGTGKTTLLDLSDKICKWPIGHPGDSDFHFCGKPSQASFPYCTEHCAVAYQAQLPRRDRPGGGGRPPYPPTMPGMRPR